MVPVRIVDGVLVVGAVAPGKDQRKGYDGYDDQKHQYRRYDDQVALLKCDVPRWVQDDGVTPCKDNSEKQYSARS
ncbi:hypothetical protein SAE02_44260 [Skermanella aerolata]|uniref:Uncharacterized protein n=1 Tax=Skermanella aerolata TaxID=393310 RepID=A0A512DUX6_9PROT|nr:hypothetical protein SAE02_44260 [Skermanella aerolata]